MIRQYLKETVYEAFQQRMHFIFKEFDHIFVSFSGGKDSGLLLNMALDFRSKYYPHKRIGVFHQDFEAQYSVTTEYVERTFQRLEKERMVDLYWVCLPMATRTCFSSYQMYWYPWDDTKEEIWVRPMPRHPYVINLKNNPMTNTAIGCIRRTWPSSLAAGTELPMEAERLSVCWESAPMNLCSGIAVF